MLRVSTLLKQCIAAPGSVSALRFYASGSVPTTKLFINGQFVESKTSDWIDLHNPATNEVITRVPKATHDEMEAAVAGCKEAFKTWSETTILTRQQLMFKFQQLIKDNLFGSKITQKTIKTKFGLNQYYMQLREMQTSKTDPN
ncbi:probable methylmalonate-semialdehyde dehydrogenase [acylating], mitochondrial [Lingula anatina]|uniref:Probable methylmalonate-semialdehyde dehydrogenase [acylating], mitochondrial n=1 Tax=Lingula anatina TaxID=7574 RepID=A0A1S3HTM4_LINAN|nr:probable methylmalonate-semialdehyde dehydrogenase [acylating], mitochondrial [Lingula anatina]|eukprot:XP_013388896.1 probable methylmalonate-semialdehyde dehydrogenase [acylating], mitochondrial [Lingula anatina]